MKIQVLAAKSRADIEKRVNEVIETQDITVHSVAYAIGPKGEREALLLYSDGRVIEMPAAVRAWLAEQLGERNAS